MIKSMIFSSLAFVQVFGMFSERTPVVQLTKDNFKEKVLDSAEIWFVEFYAPWCGHCKQLAPEYEAAAHALKGVINVGAVDMTTDEEVGKPYGVTGYPTLKYFGSDKSAPVDYTKGRNAKEIVNFSMDTTKKMVKQRLNKGENSEAKKPAKKNAQKGNDDDSEVVILTESNFKELVLESKDIWFVEFYAPWCGHCKRLQPEWNEVAATMKGRVKFGKVDATIEKKLSGSYKIKGYPTIKTWAYGEGKTAESAQDYKGGRSAPDFVKAGNKMIEAAPAEAGLTIWTEEAAAAEAASAENVAAEPTKEAEPAKEAEPVKEAAKEEL